MIMMLPDQGDGGVNEGEQLESRITTILNGD